MRDAQVWRGRLAWLAGVVAAALLAPAARADGVTTELLATGLHNPRGMAFGPDGGLYIAEAGTPVGSGPTTVVRGQTQMFTTTGSVLRYAGGSSARIYTGLPTLYNTVTGEVGGGPNDIDFTATGLPVLTLGAGINPLARSTDLAPVGTGLGQVLTLGRSWDASGHEASFNPAGGPLDSNPYRAVTVAGGVLLADAGANAILSLGNDGSISTLAVLPGRDIGGGFPSDAVPTGLAVSASGELFVGQLTGFPFTPGAAQIYRVGAGGALGVFATGFSMVIDMAFGADGNLYVLEYDSNGLLAPGDAGALWRVAADGSRSLVTASGLSHPTGLAIGADGSFYVANQGDTVDGQLLHISVVPEPASWALGLGGAALLLAGRGLRRRRRGAHAA